MLNEHSLKTIKSYIGDELLKRGFLAPISISQEEGNYPAVKIISEPFQTVPVIMKSITIDNFGGSIKEEQIHSIKNDKTSPKITIYRIWVPIHVSYVHFGGGTNGTSLFSITGYVTNDPLDDSIYEYRIN